MRALLPLLLALLSGCGVLADWGTPSRPDAIFPHPDGYDAGALHGADWFATGRDGCQTCHGDPTAAAKADESGDVGPPPCAECHAIYPHPDEFLAGAVHGAGTWGAGGSTETCDGCHAADGLVASTRFSCTACHGSWPHPESWADGDQHGPWVKERGSPEAACGSCHGDDLSDPANDGGTAGVACSRCHAGFPHASDWNRGHMATAGAVGEAVCLDCHEAGDGPSGMLATCSESCHGGAR